MVVYETNLMGVGRFPPKHDTPLVVDSDAMVALEITPERFETIPWWQPDVLYGSCCVEEIELSNSCANNFRRVPPQSINRSPMENCLCTLVAER